MHDKLYYTAANGFRLLMTIGLGTCVWAFLWWMFLVAYATKNWVIWLTFILNLILIVYYYRWRLRKVADLESPFAERVTLTFAILGVILMLAYRGSAQAVFQDFTGLLRNFTGTIAYMFDYTRQNVLVLKIVGYAAWVLYILSMMVLTYTWAFLCEADFKEIES
jgi:hypothetical protein